MPVGEHDIRDAMKAEGLDDLADALIERAMPGCELELAPSDDRDAPVGGSRFGGAPDLPPDCKWPRRSSSRFLTFIAQIATDDLHRCGATAFPRGGLLSFFYDLDPSVNGHSLTDFDAFRVLFLADPAQLVRLPRPRPVRDPSPAPQPTIPAGSIRLVPTLTLPESPPQRLDDERSKRWQQLRDRLAALRPAPRHLFGGHPDLLQDNLMWSCARYRAGIDSRRIDGHPACEDAKREAEHWRLLLQVDTDQRFDILLPGEGTLYFCARCMGRPLERLWACALCD